MRRDIVCAGCRPYAARMNSLPLRLGLLQTHADPSPDDNVARTLSLVDRAATEGATVICTQELFRTIYFPQEEDDRYFDLAEPLTATVCKELSRRAKKHGIVIVGSLFERRAPGLFHNTAVVWDRDGSVAGMYRKMHIPDDPRFYEKFYFTPGDLGFRAIQTSAGRLGVLICWDQWFPEAARLTALHGADVLIYPTAIGTWQGEKELRPIQHDAWRTMQRAHAIANGLHVAAINRVGTEGEITFWGRSFVASPDGRILAEADNQEAVLIVDCDRSRTDNARQGWPFLRDRRIDAYTQLTKRYLDDEHAPNEDD